MTITPRRCLSRFTAGRWTRFVAAAVLAATPAALAAQQVAPEPEPIPATIKYGKWAAAALALGLSGLGLRAHNGADADFRSLVAYCRMRGCPLGQDGRYTDPGAEARYQAVVSGDRAARAYLLGGQAALAATVVLFVLELKREQGTRNIPYSPFIVAPGEYGTRVGFRIAW